MKKEILFRGRSIDDTKWIYGMPTFDLSHVFNEESINSPENYEVIPESVEQYSHTTKDGERIFKPIFYSPKSRADKMREMKEGDVMTFDRSLYGSIRAHCSAINKNRKSKLKTKLSDDGEKILVICC